MSDKSAKGIDRRDLIMASIATVGAAAVAVKERGRDTIPLMIHSGHQDAAREKHNG